MPWNKRVSFQKLKLFSLTEPQENLILIHCKIIRRNICRLGLKIVKLVVYSKREFNDDVILSRLRSFSREKAFCVTVNLQLLYIHSTASIYKRFFHYKSEVESRRYVNVNEETLIAESCLIMRMRLLKEADLSKFVITLLVSACDFFLNKRCDNVTISLLVLQSISAIIFEGCPESKWWMEQSPSVPGIGLVWISICTRVILKDLCLLYLRFIVDTWLDAATLYNS